MFRKSAIVSVLFLCLVVTASADGDSTFVSRSPVFVQHSPDSLGIFVPSLRLAVNNERQGSAPEGLFIFGGVVAFVLIVLFLSGKL